MLIRFLVSQLIRQGAERAMENAFQKQDPPPEKDSAGGSESEATNGSEPSHQEQPREEPPPPLPPPEVGMVFALAIESRGVVGRMPRWEATRTTHGLQHRGIFAKRSLVLIDGGVGQEKAARAATHLIDRFDPPWIISAGFAGALRPELHRGDLVMVTQVADQEGQLLDVGLQIDTASLSSSPGMHAGRLLTVDRILRKPEEKEALGQQHAALICDMESMAVARVCRDRHKRFMAIRVVSDEMDEQLPKEIENLLKQPTLAGKMGATAGAIFRRPSSLKEMWQLREAAMDASNRLAKFLGGVVSQLTESR